MLFIVVSTGLSQEPTLRTIKDFYLLIPEKYFYLADKQDGSKSFTTESRLNAISIYDAKNGYLRLTKHWEGEAEVALFNGLNNTVYLGIIIDSCSPGCTQNITFLQYIADSKEKFLDVTSKALPTVSKKLLLSSYKSKKSPEDEDYSEDDLPILYRLPRYGTTLQIYVDQQFTNKEILLAELLWQNGQFILKN